MELLQSEIMVFVTSAFLFISIAEEYPDNFSAYLVGSAIGFLVLYIGHTVGNKYGCLKRWSPHTFLHEGAHWLVLKAFRLGPTLSMDDLKVWSRVPPRNCIEVSLAYLAPLMLWWLGLFIWSSFGSSSNIWLAGFAATVLVVLTVIGNPGDKAPVPGDGDWEQARLNGCPLLNLCLIFVGVAIIMLCKK